MPAGGPGQPSPFFPQPRRSPATSPTPSDAATADAAAAAAASPTASPGPGALADLAPLADVFTVWNLLIRPPRRHYTRDELLAKYPRGTFQVCGSPVLRSDFVLPSGRGIDLVCTLFQPHRTGDLGRQAAGGEAPSSKSCVVFCHGGAFGCRLDGFDLAPALLPMGVALACLDFGGSGESGGEFVSCGFHEREDLACFVRRLRKSLGFHRIGLWGQHMGAAVALLHGSCDSAIAGIVADGPYSDLWELTKELCTNATRLPFPLAAPLPHLLRLVVQQRAGFDVRQVSPRKAVHDCKAPVLLIYGSADKIPGPHHSEELRRHCGGPVGKVRIEGGPSPDGKRPAAVVARAAAFLVRALTKDAPGAAALAQDDALSDFIAQNIAAHAASGVQRLARTPPSHRQSLCLGLVMEACARCSPYRGAVFLPCGVPDEPGLRCPHRTAHSPGTFAGRVAFQVSHTEIALCWVEESALQSSSPRVDFAVLSPTTMSITSVGLVSEGGRGDSASVTEDEYANSALRRFVSAQIEELDPIRLRLHVGQQYELLLSLSDAGAVLSLGGSTARCPKPTRGPVHLWCMHWGGRCKTNDVSVELVGNEELASESAVAVVDADVSPEGAARRLRHLRTTRLPTFDVDEVASPSRPRGAEMQTQTEEEVTGWKLELGLREALAAAALAIDWRGNPSGALAAAMAMDWRGGSAGARVEPISPGAAPAVRCPAPAAGDPFAPFPLDAAPPPDGQQPPLGPTPGRLPVASGGRRRSSVPGPTPGGPQCGPPAKPEGPTQQTLPLAPPPSAGKARGSSPKGDTKGKGKGKAPAKSVPPAAPSKKGGGPPGAGKGPGKGKGRSVEPRKPDVQPRVPLKKLFWTPINIGEESHTVWQKIHEVGVHLDRDQLEALFANAAPAKDGGATGSRDPTPEGGKRQQRRQFLEEQRRRQLWCMLALMPDRPVLIEGIHAMDDKVLQPDKVDLLVSNLPCPAEAATALAASKEVALGENDAWDVSEDFIIQLIAVPDYAVRIAVWGFLNSFDAAFGNLMGAAEASRAAALCLRTSARVEKLLAVTLHVGNYLNGGTARGRADGFDIDTLTKLGELKASRQGTLLDFIVGHVERDCPGMLQELFAQGAEFETLRSARRHKMVELAEEAAALESQAEGLLRQLERCCSSEEADPPLRERAEQLRACRERLRGLGAAYTAWREQYADVCAWFHMDPQKPRASDDFFGIWVTFFVGVKNSLEAAQAVRQQPSKGLMRRTSSQPTAARPPEPAEDQPLQDRDPRKSLTRHSSEGSFAVFGAGVAAQQAQAAALMPQVPRRPSRSRPPRGALPHAALRHSIA